jgi:predicted MFS family arabinose efflux permease
VPLGIGLFLNGSVNPAHILLFGLSIYAVIFAINSAVHSYLIIEWSQQDTVASNVGFYYMANAGGRLAGTVLSGLIFQNYGLEGCLYVASGFVVIAAFLSKKLPSEKAYSET